MVLDRPARTLLTPRIRSPIPVLPNIRITSNEQQHLKMQQAHDAWDEYEHASLFLSLAQAKEANTSFWTELYPKLFWHAWEWHDQMRLEKSMQNHIKNNTIGATDQRESSKQDMKPYVSKSSPHTQMAQIWFSQVAKTYNNPTWMDWSKEEHHNIN